MFRGNIVAFPEVCLQIKKHGLSTVGAITAAHTSLRVLPFAVAISIPSLYSKVCIVVHETQTPVSLLGVCPSKIRCIPKEWQYASAIHGPRLLFDRTIHTQYIHNGRKKIHSSNHFPRNQIAALAIQFRRKRNDTRDPMATLEDISLSSPQRPGRPRSFFGTLWILVRILTDSVRRTIHFGTIVGGEPCLEMRCHWNIRKKSVLKIVACIYIPLHYECHENYSPLYSHNTLPF